MFCPGKYCTSCKTRNYFVKKSHNFEIVISQSATIKSLYYKHCFTNVLNTLRATKTWQQMTFSTLIAAFRYQIKLGTTCEDASYEMSILCFKKKKIFYHKPKFEVYMYHSRALRFKESCADPESFFQRGSNFDNVFFT